MSKIKTLHVTPASMSLQVLLRTRLNIMADSGFTVIGYSTADDYGIAFKDSGFECVLSKHLTRSFSLTRDFLFFIEAYRLFRRLKPTIVNTYGPKPGVYARIAARLAGVPIIVHTSWGFFFQENDSKTIKNLILLLEWFCSLWSDFIFSVNRDDLRIMQRLIPNKKLDYLGNATDVWGALDPSAYNPETCKSALAIPAGTLVIGIVARLTISKGYREFIQVAKSLKKKYSSLVFMVVGPFDLVRSEGISKDEISMLEQMNVIKYLGNKEHSEIPMCLAAMDIVVLPSFREGFPRSLVEAAAMGKPIVTSNIRGCREAVHDGVNGLLVAPGDVKSLEKAIQTLVEDASMRERMGHAGRKMAEKLFDEKVLVKKVTDRYRTLLNEKQVSN